MTLSLERALLIVRDLDASGSGGPDVPLNWTSVPQLGNWYELTRNSDGQQLFAFRENFSSSTGLFAVFGSISILTELNQTVPLSLPAMEAWRRRNEAGIKPYLRFWRTLSGSGLKKITTEGSSSIIAWSGTEVILPEQSRFPDWQTQSLPWNFDEQGNLTIAASASIRVESVHSIQIKSTIFGLGCDVKFHNEPDTEG